jgi:hypothetical protein
VPRVYLHAPTTGTGSQQSARTVRTTPQPRAGPGAQLPRRRGEEGEGGEQEQPDDDLRELRASQKHAGMMDPI